MNDAKYAAEKYFNHPSYLRIDGKPVFFIYNLPFLYHELNSTIHGLLDNMRQQTGNTGVYLVRDLGQGLLSPDDADSYVYSLNATTNYVYSSPSIGWDAILGNATLHYPEWHSRMNAKGIRFIPNVYPAYNNTGLSDVTIPTGLAPNETMFRQFTYTALKNADDDDDDVGIVMVTPWNEWLEGTSVEPSMELGEMYLHNIYDSTPEFSSYSILLPFILLPLATIPLMIALIQKKLKNAR